MAMEAKKRLLIQKLVLPMFSFLSTICPPPTVGRSWCSMQQLLLRCWKSQRGEELKPACCEELKLTLVYHSRLCCKVKGFSSYRRDRDTQEKYDG